MTPISPLRLVTRARAAWLRRYPSSAMAASTASRVSGRTAVASLSTRETVWCDTSARAATSAIVGAPEPAFMSGTLVPGRTRARFSFEGREVDCFGPGEPPGGGHSLGPGCMLAITSAVAHRDDEGECSHAGHLAVRCAPRRVGCHGVHPRHAPRGHPADGARPRGDRG